MTTTTTQRAAGRSLVAQPVSFAELTGSTPGPATTAPGLQVTSPIEGTYLVHEPRQHPVEGVAVWYYERVGVWACEEHGSAAHTTRTECAHIQVAREG